MRLSFLALPPDERRLYFEQAALRRNVAPVILEKDFWVCWLLGILFESQFADTECHVFSATASAAVKIS